MPSLGPYTKAAEEQLQRYRVELKSKNSTGFGLALSYHTWQIMLTQLQKPASVLIYDSLGPEHTFGFRGPARWTLDMRALAENELDPGLREDPTGVRWVAKQNEYISFGILLITDSGFRERYTEDRGRGVGYLIRENPEFPKIMALIATALTDWAQQQLATEAFFLMPAEIGYATMLHQREDVIALLRAAQLLPLDVEHTAVEIPTNVEIAEFLISLIPYVGNIAAAYEAYSGQNLFGYHLTDIERGILAATILLPIAGKLVKGGRALYTEARLVKLYGRDAGKWSQVVSKSGKITQDGQKLATIEKAAKAIEAGQHLDAKLAADASKALDVLKEGGGAVSKAVNPLVADGQTAIKALSTHFASLDEFAIERILLKGGNTSHLKGQILEELLESKIVPWLRERWGAFSLGLEVPVGKQLEFVPGHLVRDLGGRQITDGLLGFREGKTFHVLAVFEAKAGPNAARELSFSRKALTDAEKLELRAAARDELLDLREQARLEGKPFKKTLDQLIKEYKTGEVGGQVRRDIERLAGSEGIKIGNMATEISFSPNNTKFFGVVPAGLKSSLVNKLTAQLTAEKVSFEIIAADVTTAELDAAAVQLQSLATNLVAGPVPPIGVPPAPRDSR